MSIDDVLKWIGNKNFKIAMSVNSDNITNYTREYYRGMSIVLEELRLYIQKRTNPHNREDIKRINDGN